MLLENTHILKKPFFSIVIPTYNRAEDLQFALFCIFRQNFNDFEVVISDNCSTDKTEEVIGNLKDKRIRYYRTKKTLGNALNMKRAIEQAKGEYIFLHSDDDFFLYKNSLQEIYREIIKHNPGYVRVNYINISFNKKRIFDFRIGKAFKGTTHFPAFFKNKQILAFIIASDPYFITGIIFKNSLPNDIGIIDTDPAPWVEILFYMVKNFGACFIIQPHIVAFWSRRKIKKNTPHHVFTLIDGKLRSENYLNAIKKKINKEEYSIFLHNELIRLYVRIFPIIKAHVGNKIMIKMANRMRIIDGLMGKSITYWGYLVGALIFPRHLLRIARDVALYLYTKFSRVEDDKQIMITLKNLELEYLQSNKNVIKINNPIFKF